VVSGYLRDVPSLYCSIKSTVCDRNVVAAGPACGVHQPISLMNAHQYCPGYNTASRVQALKHIHVCWLECVEKVEKSGTDVVCLSFLKLATVLWASIFKLM